MKDNCIVAQSGGPTVAINASLAGVIDGVKKSNKFTRVYGAIHGIQGVLDNNFIDLSLMALSKFPLVNTLELSPAMYLGSCRYKLPDFEVDSKPYEIIFDRFEEYQVAAFFYIGGNDSMDTVDKLSKYAKKIGSDVKIVGIPKTIDNDLCHTDHTPSMLHPPCWRLPTTLTSTRYQVLSSWRSWAVMQAGSPLHPVWQEMTTVLLLISYIFLR